MSEIIVASATLRDRVAEVETALAGLTDAAAAAGVNSYGDPENAALRQTADEAMAALHSVQQELDRLRIALPAAEQAERNHAQAVAEAERQKAKDRLVRDRDLIVAQYLKLESKITGDQAILDTAVLDADVLADEWRNANVKVEVYRERVSNDTRRLDDLAGQHLDLDQEIATFPVTAQEVAAIEQARREAAETEAEAIRRRFEADTAEQIARLRGEQMIEVEPIRLPHDERPFIGWTFSAGFVVAVPRKDLEKFEAAKERLATAEAERLAAEEAERGRVTLLNAVALTRPT